MDFTSTRHRVAHSERLDFTSKKFGLYQRVRLPIKEQSQWVIEVIPWTLAALPNKNNKYSSRVASAGKVQSDSQWAAALQIAAMGTVHDLIEQHGKQAALLAEVNRHAVEAAAAYMADEDNGIGFLYSGWCQAALPHRRLPDDKAWQIRSDHVNMLVQPGLRPSSFGDPEL